MPQVFVNKQPVGVLTRGGLEQDERGRPRQGTHAFSYEPGLEPGQAVSLLMPIGEGASVYRSSAPNLLHPVFDQNLPEGALREAIRRMFAKALPAFDDFALLEIVGRSSIGRFQLAASSAALGEELPPQDVGALLKKAGTAALFRELLERYAAQSGVSGVQPKLLVRDDGAFQVAKLSPPLEMGERFTYPGATHILKGFDAMEYPCLAANEFVCLQAARAAGLPVPQASLAEDGGLLAIERFDLNGQGGYLGFEDLCSLAGYCSEQKYAGSYEQVAKVLRNFLTAPEGIDQELRAFFKSVVLSVAVRNGDAHRKNFGVLYASAVHSPVRLAPVYDVLTTTAYLPADALALSLDGTKRWPSFKRMLHFGLNQCGLRAADARAAIDEVAEGIVATRTELSRIEDTLVQTRMRQAWEDGLASLVAPRVTVRVKKAE